MASIVLRIPFSMNDINIIMRMGESTTWLIYSSNLHTVWPGYNIVLKLVQLNTSCSIFQMLDNPHNGSKRFVGPFTVVLSFQL